MSIQQTQDLNDLKQRVAELERAVALLRQLVEQSGQKPPPLSLKRGQHG